MKETLFALIGISLMQSILLLIVKDEVSGRILKMVGGVAMAAALLAGFTAFDYQTYAASLKREQTEIRAKVDSIEENANTLHRRYIESECAAYILENAAQMQIELTGVTVTLAWNANGFWYPVHADIVLKDHHADTVPLKQLLERELGIPLKEQIWRFEDGSY